MFFGLLLLSCNAPTSIEMGTYHPVKYNWLEKRWHHLTNTASPSEQLELKKDSTFIFTACVTEYGKWSIYKNTLILKVEEVNWTIDSFNISGYKGRCPTLPKEPYKFTIKHNYLVRISKFKSKGKERRLLQKLAKL